MKRALIAQAKQEAFDGGLLPLQVILARMRNEPLPDGSMATDAQLAAANMAAPYIHPRLASTDTTVKSDNVHRVVSDKPITNEDWAEKYGAGTGPVTVANDDAA